ncbi:MAG: TraM recognition domain-containing protein [Acidimicrobiales bacterium]
MSARPSDDAGLFAVVGVFGLFVALAIGGLLSALLSGHGLPTRHAAGAITAFAHLRNPSLAWRVPVGPAWLYWLVSAAVLGTASIVATRAVRFVTSDARARADDSSRAGGVADRGEILRAAGVKPLRARGRILRPSLQKPEVRDLGFFLGTSRNVSCFASVEDSTVILGPPRSGKGHNLVIPFILDAPGAVVTTSTRPDNLAVTMTERRARGPVGVFDPQGLAAGVESALRWSPIRGCEQPETAMLRARALCAGVSANVTDANFWQQQTEVVLRCLLQAAAVSGRGVSDLFRWSLSPDEAKEAVELLRASPRATPLWSRALGAVVGLEPRQRANIWSVVSSVCAPFSSPRVIEQLTPVPGAEFEPEVFLRENGTLYLLGTSSGAMATSNIVSALIEDVVETARRLASRSAGARLDPPLSLILDEAANYPMPSLGSLMSEGGGTGITTVAVFQSLAQARDRWGVEQAQAIWDSATTKIILGGSSNANDLRDLAHLIGDRETRELSTTRQAGGGRNVTESSRERAVLTPSDIRLISPGHALLLLRAARPIMLKLRPWTARRDASELTEQRALVEDALRTGATHSSWR